MPALSLRPLAMLSFMLLFASASGVLRGSEGVPIANTITTADVKEKITELRAKLQKVRSIIAEQKASDGHGESAAVKVAASAEAASQLASTTSADEAAKIIDGTEVGDASIDIPEASVEKPPPHLLGSTTSDLPSDRPLNPSAEKDPLLEKKHQKIRHDMDASLHAKDRFVHADNAATLEKAVESNNASTGQGETADAVAAIATAMADTGGNELEYPDIDSPNSFPVGGKADGSADAWDEADQQVENMDMQPLGQPDQMMNQMNQLLAGQRRR